MSSYPSHPPHAHGPPPRPQPQQGGGDGWLIGGGIALVALFALPAALLMLAAPSMIRRWPRVLAGAAILGVLVFGIGTRQRLGDQWATTKTTLRTTTSMGGKLGLLAGVAPWFWLWTLPLAPAAGYVYDFFRPRSLQDQHDDKQQRTQQREGRQIQRAQTTAAAAIPAAAEAKKRADRALLGVHLRGDPLFFTRKVRELLYLNTEVGASSLHMLFLGENGAGKSQSMFRVMASIAAATDWQIFYLDPKNDAGLRQEFYNLMAAHGRTARIFPAEDYNGWEGDRGALLSRIMTIPAYSDEGGAAFYQDVAEVYLRLVLDAWPDLPTCFEELEERLDYPTVKLKIAGNPILEARFQSIAADDARSVAMRFRAMTPKLQAIRRGGWRFQDTPAAYFGLPVLANSRDSAAIAKFILEDIKHFLAERSSPDQRKVFFIDEFASLGTEAVIQLMEMARSLGGVLGLAVQTLAGLGDRAQQQRITGNVTLVLHRMSDAEDLTRLAGVIEQVQVTRHMEHDRDTKRGSMRIEEAPKVSPQAVRTLPTGVAWLIARGQAAQVAMAQAPAVPEYPMILSDPLPPPKPAEAAHQGEDLARRAAEEQAAAERERAERAAMAVSIPPPPDEREEHPRYAADDSEGAPAETLAADEDAGPPALDSPNLDAPAGAGERSDQ